MSDYDGKLRARELARLARMHRDTDAVDDYNKCLSELKDMGVRFIVNSAWKTMYPDDDTKNTMILKEKHGTRYVDISTPDAMAEACLSVVAQRLEEEWITEEERLLIKQERPIARAYFDALFFSLLHMDISVDGKNAYDALKKSNEYKEMVSNVTDADAHTRLSIEAYREPVNEIAVAMLCARVMNYDRQIVRELLGEHQGNPLLDAVLDTVPNSEADNARFILNSALNGTPGALRRAGREAFTFLSVRSGYEYEEIEVESLEKPSSEWKVKFSQSANNPSP